MVSSPSSERSAPARDRSAPPPAASEEPQPHPAIGRMYTCDACSENETPIAEVEPGTEAYICQGCVDVREAAINAGALALAAELGHTLAAIGLDGATAVATAAPNTLRIARKVIGAYESHYTGSSDDYR